MRFWGGSKLVGPNGRTQARAKYGDEDLLVSEVNHSHIKSVQDFIPMLRDLHPELLDVLKKEETASLKG
jgi:predicted amidohydrolase